jgi:hypothetical protein
MMVPVGNALLDPNTVDFVLFVDNVGSVAATGVNWMLSFEGRLPLGASATASCTQATRMGRSPPA